MGEKNIEIEDFLDLFKKALEKSEDRKSVKVEFFSNKFDLMNKFIDDKKIDIITAGSKEEQNDIYNKLMEFISEFEDNEMIVVAMFSDYRFSDSVFKDDRKRQIYLYSLEQYDILLKDIKEYYEYQQE